MYIDIAYIKKNSPYFTPELIDILTNDEQLELYIARACSLLNKYKYNGYKADPNSTDAFPRIINGRNVGIPEDLKLATLYTVCDLYKRVKQTEYTEQINKLRALGVTSFNVGGASMNLAQQEPNKLTPDVIDLLEPYMGNYTIGGGGYGGIF